MSYIFNPDQRAREAQLFHAHDQRSDSERHVSDKTSDDERGDPSARDGEDRDRSRSHLR